MKKTLREWMSKVKDDCVTEGVYRRGQIIVPDVPNTCVRMAERKWVWYWIIQLFNESVS